MDRNDFWEYVHTLRVMGDLFEKGGKDLSLLWGHLFKVDFEHFSKSIKILGMGTPFLLLATLWNWLHE